MPREFSAHLTKLRGYPISFIRLNPSVWIYSPHLPQRGTVGDFFDVVFAKTGTAKVTHNAQFATSVFIKLPENINADTPISELFGDLSDVKLRILGGKFVNVGRLVQAGEARILETHNIGPEVVGVVEKRLSMYGLDLHTPVEGEYGLLSYEELRFNQEDDFIQLRGGERNLLARLTTALCDREANALLCSESLSKSTDIRLKRVRTDLLKFYGDQSPVGAAIKLGFPDPREVLPKLPNQGSESASGTISDEYREALIVVGACWKAAYLVARINKDQEPSSMRAVQGVLVSYAHETAIAFSSRFVSTVKSVGHDIISRDLLPRTPAQPDLAV